MSDSEFSRSVFYLMVSYLNTLRSYLNISLLVFGYLSSIQILTETAEFGKVIKYVDEGICYTCTHSNTGIKPLSHCPTRLNSTHHCIIMATVTKAVIIAFSSIRTRVFRRQTLWPLVIDQ